jgi:hypothetical protein
MLVFAPSNKEGIRTGPMIPDFHSVEFPLGHVQPLYQFKLWRSEKNTFFLLAKEPSDLVDRLKVGCIVPMKYYGEDAMGSTEVHDTQIVEIVKETEGRFSGHYRIELLIVSNGHGESQFTDNNDKQQTRI